MAKVAFTKLGLKLNKEVKTFIWNDQEIEIKQYLPVDEKLALIGNVISNSYEDTIRTAVSMGGDADTMACIAGAIAEAYYGLPQDIEEQMYKFLSPDIIMVVEEFRVQK